MENQKLLNKVITISAEETKKTQYGLVKKIKDEKGLTYNFYDTTSKGTASVAWEQYQELNIGDTVQIGYVEEIKEYQGKNYIARTIRNFNKDIGNGVKQARGYQGSQESKIGRPGAKSGASEPTDWDSIAVGKCQTVFLAAYLQAGNTFEDTKLKVTQAKCNPPPFRTSHN